MEPDKVKELADDIARIGLLHFIVVRSPNPGEATNDKPYVLMAGGRRLAAHMVLGRDEIEARLKDDLSPFDQRVAELSENVRRENLTFSEEADARAELASLLMSTRTIERAGATPDHKVSQLATLADVAADIGISHSMLTRDVKLSKAMKADPTLRMAASRGAAFRALEHKTIVADRLANAELNKAQEVADLRKKLVTADGISFIQDIPTASIDLVFSDLPYGIDYFEVLKDGSEVSKGAYDDKAAPAKAFMTGIVPQCLRVVKPSGWIVFFMCYEFHEYLQNLIRNSCRTHMTYSMDDEMHCSSWKVGSDCSYVAPELPPWIWTRRGKGNFGHAPDRHAANRYEMLVVVNGGAARFAKKPVENVLDFPPMSNERLHAMQKPHDLCREIIERTTVVGERVLDICFGSGAHLAAAASLGRDFLGCDSNPANLDGALGLVSQHYNPKAAATLARAKGADAGLDAAMEELK